MEMKATSRAVDKKLQDNNKLKKNPKDFEKLEHEFFENAKEKNLSNKLVWYVWRVLVYMQRG